MVPSRESVICHRSAPKPVALSSSHAVHMDSVGPDRPGAGWLPLPSMSGPRLRSPRGGPWAAQRAEQLLDCPDLGLGPGGRGAGEGAWGPQARIPSGDLKQAVLIMVFLKERKFFSCFLEVVTLGFFRELAYRH